MLKGLDAGNGFEAVRQLIRSRQPSNRNRSIALLQVLMQWPHFEMKQAMLPQILKLEDSFREYERVGGQLTSEMKFSVLMRCMGGQLKIYLQVTFQETKTFDDLRENIIRYDSAPIKWSNSMSLGAPMPGAPEQPPPEDPNYKGPRAMEVDRLTRGKGKDGKGKKGQKGDKGSWKGKGKNSWNQGKGGQNSDNWNKPKGNEKGKKGNQKGKGKSNSKGPNAKPDVKCHNCGKIGHYARDCWSKKVRSVEEENETAHSETKTTSGTVNRASLHQQSSSSSSLVLDLSQIEAFSEMRISTGSIESGIECSSHLEESIVVNAVEEEDSAHVERSTWEFVNDDEEGSVHSEESGWELEPENQTVKERLIETEEYKHFSRRGVEIFRLFNLFGVDDSENFTNNVVRDYSLDLYEISDANAGGSSKIQEDLAVRQVRNTSLQEIVLDSGSDATVLPLSFQTSGKAVKSSSTSILRNAQGGRSNTQGLREVRFELETVTGHIVKFRDKGFVSAKVEHPLLSCGKLLKTGWSIISTDDGPRLTHSSGAQIRVAFRNHSLMLQGHIRAVTVDEQTAEAIAIGVDIPRSWHHLRNGWYEINEEVHLHVGPGKRFVGVTQEYIVTEWPMTVEELGLVITDEGEAARSREPSGSSGPQPVQQQATQPSAQPIIQPDAMQVEPEQERPEVPQAVARPRDERDTLTLAGIDVNKDSSILLLKAACDYLQISQSGSKQELRNRILAELEKRALVADEELADIARDGIQRRPEAVHTAEPPIDKAEIDKRNLTHFPYVDWCEACAKAKGRPDRHMTDTSRGQRREYPIISWDFFYTGKSCEEVAEDSEQAKLTAKPARRKNVAPPPSAAVAASATPRAETTDVPMATTTTPLGVEQAGPIGRPVSEEAVEGEPAAKRSRAQTIIVMQIGEEELCHTDLAYEDVKDDEYTKWFDDETAKNSTTNKDSKDVTDTTKTAASNQAAKNLLQVMSVFSLMSVAAGEDSVTCKMLMTHSMCGKICIMMTLIVEMMSKRLFMFVVTLMLCFKLAAGQGEEEALGQGYVNRSRIAITVICILFGLLYLLMRWRTRTSQSVALGRAVHTAYPPDPLESMTAEERAEWNRMEDLMLFGPSPPPTPGTSSSVRNYDDGPDFSPSMLALEQRRQYGMTSVEDRLQLFDQGIFEIRFGDELGPELPENFYPLNCTTNEFLRLMSSTSVYDSDAS
eukprot:Skav200590  [mRNA]  locus=scaffold2706:15622:22171:+ [translate_table: standard]